MQLPARAPSFARVKGRRRTPPWPWRRRAFAPRAKQLWMARHWELWCQQSAQRTFNPHGVGATPTGSTSFCHRQSSRADAGEIFRRRATWNCCVPRRARAAKGPACKAGIRGCKSRRRVHFGVVVLIAARRARNAEETERNRPAPPFLRTWPTSKAAVSKTARCRSVTCRPCQFSGRLGRSSDGAWLKTTRARRATASLHHFS